MLTTADRAALADRAAGRLIDSRAMAQRLAGWQIGRRPGIAGSPPATRPLDSLRSRFYDETMPLLWAHGAVTECDRLGRQLAALGCGGERRFAAALMATMVCLIADGAGAEEGAIVGDVPLLASLTLRVATAHGRMTALGLRGQPVIR